MNDSNLLEGIVAPKQLGGQARSILLLAVSIVHNYAARVPRVIGNLVPNSETSSL
jgi:hypothetical protein